MDLVCECGGIGEMDGRRLHAPWCQYGRYGFRTYAKWRATLEKIASISDPPQSATPGSAIASMGGLITVIRGMARDALKEE